jgi:hypothetical protein
MSDEAKPARLFSRLIRGPQCACTNCEKPIEYPSIFKGVVVCPECLKLATHLQTEARKHLQKAFDTYSEVLKTALIKRQLHLPLSPDETPIKEVAKDEKETGSEVHNSMQTLRSDNND